MRPAIVIKSVPYPWFGQNVARFGWIGFDLFAQLADEHAQVFGLFRVIAAPDRAEQRAVRQDFARVADQVREQFIFFRR